MKSIIKEGNTSDKGFPKLMIFHDKSFIVLFNNRDEGTVVYCNDGVHDLGYYSVTWSTELFEDFNGTIELSND